MSPQFTRENKVIIRWRGGVASQKPSQRLTKLEKE